MPARSPSAASPGQNLFGTAGATGFYIDDTPLPGSVDPRILDIDNIEVLKGPQGTLYGESSLGGNIRLVTKQPNLNTNSFSYSADAGVTSGAGSPDGGLNAVGNLVLIPDKLALHIVAFGDHEGGYLTRTYPDASSPATTDPFYPAASHQRRRPGRHYLLWRKCERPVAGHGQLRR